MTPGNASGINDGAAALVLCSGKVLQDKQLTPKAKIIGFAEAAIEGINMGIAPIPAIEKLVKRFTFSSFQTHNYVPCSSRKLVGQNMTSISSS